MVGRIFKVIAGYYDIFSDGKMYRVRGAGKLRQSDISPLVGDFVEFNQDKFVEKILPRKNSLVRPKVANIDQAAIIISTTEPKYSSLFLNKLLSVVEFNKIRPILIFTKEDLKTISAPEEYKNDGYIVYTINNNEKSTLEPLEHIFSNQLTVFTGFSGSGKSTTIANLTNTKRETQEISKFLQRGKHTTRVVEIIKWNGGMLIDSPGFSSFSTLLSVDELARSFKDFKRLKKLCKFKNCLHDREIDCAIKIAVENKKISIKRYQDYLKILKEIKDE